MQYPLYGKRVSRLVPFHFSRVLMFSRNVTSFVVPAEVAVCNSNTPDIGFWGLIKVDIKRAIGDKCWFNHFLFFTTESPFSVSENTTSSKSRGANLRNVLAFCLCCVLTPVLSFAQASRKYS